MCATIIELSMCKLQKLDECGGWTSVALDSECEMCFIILLLNKTSNGLLFNSRHSITQWDMFMNYCYLLVWLQKNQVCYEFIMNCDWFTISWFLKGW